MGKGNKELYSILAKIVSIIPDSYFNNTLFRYSSEEGKTTLLDFFKDNIFIVIAVIIVIIAMLLLIIFQRRVIRAKKKEEEQRRVADELNRRVYIDSLTSVRNKGGYYEYIGALQKRVEQGEITEYAICVFDCDDLKYINDNYGHEKGDEYLKSASHLICKIFRYSPVFRVGGDEFIAVLLNEDLQNSAKLIEQFDSVSEAINEAEENEWLHVHVSLGMAEYDAKTDSSVEDTAKRADEKMYENKRKRKADRSVSHHRYHI